MESIIVTSPSVASRVTVEQPRPGPGDVLVRIRACGICGSDSLYVEMGGAPPHFTETPLGHEPAGEVVAVGASVSGVAVGDHVVINPMAQDGVIGNGGPRGALAEFLLLPDAIAGQDFRVIPSEIPWSVAALNEPMAVAYHGVNRSGATQGTKAVVFGAGPIGLGAAIGLAAKGAEHVVVVDVVARRLEKALAVGADAVINSAEEDVVARLRELHGEVPGFYGAPPRPATDVYLDAAGAPAVFQTVMSAVKHRAVYTIVAVYKDAVELDLQQALTSEVDIRLSMGYPTEIFSVTDSIIADWQKYQHIISDLVPFAEVERALTLARTPGAADKVIVTFD